MSVRQNEVCKLVILHKISLVGISITDTRVKQDIASTVPRVVIGSL